MEAGKPGSVPIDEAVRRLRAADPASGRAAGPVRRWRVARLSARRFEVTEKRLLPPDRLPARPVMLHHYYTLVPAGDGYFTIKMSTSRDTYLEHREAYERLLESFRILGYP